jgi:hypothetical protein
MREKQAKRVLVCGGRDYADTDHVNNELIRLHAEHGPWAAVIHGDATGADHEAMLWAMMMKIPHRPFRADWRTHGRAAGPIRNQRMIDEGKPDLVIAFPGGRGTANMIESARRAGLRVIEVAPRTSELEGAP